MNDYSNKKIIIGITGASGAIYGISLLKMLNILNIESHLIISNSARLTILSETTYTRDQLIELASYHYAPQDIAARLSSGSFRTDGMIIAPCSMRTLASIAHGFDNNLISRTAGVVIKEQKKLVLMVRETPLSAINLENMLKLSRLGVSISPPVPAFYNHPTTIEQLVNHSIARILDLFGIDSNTTNRWNGITKNNSTK